MQMTFESGMLVATRTGRTVAIQQVSEADKYQALLKFNVRATVAAAVAKGLVTVNVRVA